MFVLMSALYLTDVSNLESVEHMPALERTLYTTQDKTNSAFVSILAPRIALFY